MFLLCLFLFSQLFGMPHVLEQDMEALFNRSTIYIAPPHESAPWLLLGCECNA